MEIYHKEQQFKMLVLLSPIFVADTKTIFGYDFVAPLTFKVSQSANIQRYICDVISIFVFMKARKALAV